MACRVRRAEAEQKPIAEGARVRELALELAASLEQALDPLSWWFNFGTAQWKCWLVPRKAAASADLALGRDVCCHLSRVAASGFHRKAAVGRRTFGRPELEPRPVVVTNVSCLPQEPESRGAQPSAVGLALSS